MTRSRRRKLARAQALGQRPLLRRGIPVASALLVAAPGVYADQQQPATGSGAEALQEVVVTAEKRVENLQNVPISVQVFDSTKLNQLGIVNIDDYVKFSPSVSYVRGQGEGSNGQPGDDHVYIRGVVSGGDGNHSGSQPSVGVYFDEQPVTTIDGTPEVHIYDVQRIEVLEGPQGTLFGASSESGTIRIISNKPDPSKFAAGYDLQTNEVDHGGTGWEAEGFVNLPLTPIAAVRLVAWDEHDAGYINNVAGTDLNGCIVNGVRTFPTWAGQGHAANSCPTVGTVGAGAISNASSLKNDYNTADTKGGRAALKLDLGDWTITPTLMTQDVATNGFFAYDPAVGDLDLVHFGPEHSDDSWYQAALTIEGKLSDFDLVYAGGYMKRTSHTIAEYSDYSEFYDRVFGSGAYWVNNAGKPIMPEEFVIGGGYFEKWSHELRLTTPEQYPVKGTFGLFIQRQLHDIWQDYTMPGYNGNAYGGNPQGFASSLSIPGMDNTIWLTDEQRVDRDQAAFAQVTWDITSQWALTGGLRYYKYDNGLAGFYGYSKNYSHTTGQSQCFAPALSAGLAGAPCTDLLTDVSDTGTVPKVNLTYKVSPDAMLYATYSKGFRPGGVNRVTIAGFPPYKADYLTNYEVGWKTQWFDHRLRWNGALFWEDWKNFQFSFLVPPSITAIANGGNARIKGLENELDWVATDHLLITNNITWLDPVLTQDYCGGSFAPGQSCAGQVTYTSPFIPGGAWVGPQAPAGTNLPVVPKFKGNIIARYTWGEISEFSPYAQASWVYQTQTAPVLPVPTANTYGMMPAYGLVDLAGGFNRNSINVEVFVTNVTDKRAQLSRFTESNPVNDNQVYILPTQPRTIGIKFSQRF